jgi:hypothetical protein
MNKLVLNQIYSGDQLMNCDLNYIGHLKLTEFLDRYYNNYEWINKINRPSIKKNILLSFNSFFIFDNKLADSSRHVIYNLKSDFLYLDKKAYSQLDQEGKDEQYLDFLSTMDYPSNYANETLPLDIKNRNTYYNNIYKTGTFMSIDYYKPIDLSIINR